MLARPPSNQRHDTSRRGRPGCARSTKTTTPPPRDSPTTIGAATAGWSSTSRTSAAGGRRGGRPLLQALRTSRGRTGRSATSLERSAPTSWATATSILVGGPRSPRSIPSPRMALSALVPSRRATHRRAGHARAVARRRRRHLPKRCVADRPARRGQRPRPHRHRTPRAKPRLIAGAPRAAR